jgi:GT2 family glycosyltransferase
LPVEKKVSAIVVNWNGREFLPACLDSISQQSYHNLEVIVVDCASKDESVSLIRHNYPLTKVIELKQDFGPPYAINLACREAQGEYILILNNDVYLPENLVAEMTAELEKDENCVITPVELNWENKYVHSGIPDSWIGRYLYKIIKLKGESPFYPSTACCLVTREMLLTNPLNETLFMYEDTEWGWRLHLKKLKIKVLFDSFFRHKGAGTNLDCSPKQALLMGRVALSTCFICFRLTTFILLLSILALEYIRHIVRFARRRNLNSIKSYFQGILHFFTQIKFLAQKRKSVQTTRLINDFEILKLMIGSIDFEKKAKENWILSTSVLKPPEREFLWKK